MDARGREPLAMEVAQILAQSRPDLERLFQRHWVTEEEADALLAEALSSLVMQWDRIVDPALWMVRVIGTAIQRRLLIPLFH